MNTLIWRPYNSVGAGFQPRLNEELFSFKTLPKIFVLLRQGDHKCPWHNQIVKFYIRLSPPFGNSHCLLDSKILKGSQEKNQSNGEKFKKMKTQKTYPAVLMQSNIRIYFLPHQINQNPESPPKKFPVLHINNLVSDIEKFFLMKAPGKSYLPSK